MLLFQRMMYRVDLRMNPSVYYLMGDNEERRGQGGQAAEMRGEPNMIGIRTKRSPGRDEPAYWSDADFERQAYLLDEDFQKVADIMVMDMLSIVVCPLDVTGTKQGLGTGMSELGKRAPRTLAYIERWVDILKGIQS